MTSIDIVVLLASGLLVGLSSGLLGVGGGFIMTPIQFWIFTSAGIPADTAIKLAFGTNLAVILLTSISGTLQHSRRGTVLWRAALVMGSCSLVVAFGGATLATHLPASVLRILFGVVIIGGSVRLLWSRTPETAQAIRENTWLWVSWAIPIGFVTGATGIGGGSLAIPIMVLALHFSMHQSVGTSLAVMIFSSTGAIAGYVVNGLGVSGLPDYSIGYVNLIAWLALSATSVAMAQVGASIAHRVAGNRLRQVFVVLMVYVGLRMVGIFEWLGWPL